jgi:hypothetical protein
MLILDLQEWRKNEYGPGSAYGHGYGDGRGPGGNPPSYFTGVSYKGLQYGDGSGVGGGYAPHDHLPWE